MRLKSLLAMLLIGIVIISCNSNSSSKSKKVGYTAKIDSSWTLTQVAKENNIGEPYLRTKLGIKSNIGKHYTIMVMAKRFDFEINDLKKIIEDRKNSSAKIRLDLNKKDKK